MLCTSNWGSHRASLTSSWFLNRGRHFVAAQCPIDKYNASKQQTVVEKSKGTIKEQRQPYCHTGSRAVRSEEVHLLPNNHIFWGSVYFL